MIGPVTEPKINYLESGRPEHYEFRAPLKDGSLFVYQGKGAEAKNASGDVIKVSEPLVTFTTPNRNDKLAPLESALASDRKIVAFDQNGERFISHLHTYKASDLTPALFKHYGVTDPEKEITTKRGPTAKMKRVVQERNANGDIRYRLIAHSYNVEHELREGTPYADSANKFKRAIGQLGHRYRELGKGIGQSLRDPVQTGAVGGRVIMTSVVLNIFVYALVASLGLYKLHKNDQAQAAQQAALMNNP